MIFPIYPCEIIEEDIPYFMSLLEIPPEKSSEESPGTPGSSVKIDLLAKSAAKGSSTVRLQAMIELVTLELGSGNYESAAGICLQSLSDETNNIFLSESLLESYYLMKDYKGLDEALLKVTDMASAKLAYYRFVSDLYNEKNSVVENFTSLLTDYPSSELSLNAVNLLKEFGIELPYPIALLADFKVHLLKREFNSVSRITVTLIEMQVQGISTLLDKDYIVDDQLLSPVILDEMYRTAASLGNSAQLLPLINEILSLPSRAGFESGEVYSYEFLTALNEKAGYLCRNLGRYAAAAEFFLEGLQYAEGEQYEKMLWYWYNSVFRDSPRAAAVSIKQLSELWTEPDYFSDVLTDLATYIVQQGWWIVLQDVLSVIKYTGSDESISKYAYLAARSGMESYVVMNDDQIRSLLDLSYESGHGTASGLYYRILAGYYLGISENQPDFRTGGSGGYGRYSLPGKSGAKLESDPVNDELPFPNWFFTRTAKNNPEVLRKGNKGSSELICGFLKFELPLNAYLYLMSNPFSDWDLVRETAKLLSESNNSKEAIRLLSYYAQFEGFNLRLDDFHVLYPNAYGKEIAEVSDNEGLKKYVFSALVREESLFQHDVISSAGAVGLSQLMPATAADVAVRLGVNGYDLKDAQTNLSFGGWYLGNLTSRTDVLSDALFAYNGGLTRVRRWRQEYSELPDDLFLEAVPYRETSHYGRKVLVSSVIYGYLYEDIQPYEIIRLFYRI